MKVTQSVTAILLAVCCVAAEPAAHPLNGHPGNIFLAGQDVIVPCSGDYRLLDYDRKVVKEGKAENERANLGQLPVGYYELVRPAGGSTVSVGVLAPLAARTPDTSPIAIDVAMSWFYSDDKKEAVASLCRLAGINWVRDRLAWGAVEPRKGRFTERTQYDSSARIQSAAGLKVLQVNHSSPQWANPDGKRFPLDLRDAYNFHREIARRWKGQVLAFEPWNEADIDVFGGHTGAEMASMQKASYLGVKAGNPEAIASLNVFASNRRAQQEDLADNETSAYFDTCNLHHYIAPDKYPDWYASFRAICAGKPLWVTEFSMPVQWSDEKTKELDEQTLRTQADRVPMAFAMSLHEGSAASFYFLMPHYVEGKTQFGILRNDLTPRPAYVALAAVGRLLAGARPIGKVDGELKGYLFNARPDGQEREVGVVWMKQGERQFNVPDGVKFFDVLGRPVEFPQGRATITQSPLFAVAPANVIPHDGLIAAPPAPPLERRKPSPIVMQALWPAKQLVLSRSAYRISSEKAQSIPVFIYNFSDRPAKGTLAIEGPKAWKLSLPGEVELAPGDRKELALAIDCNKTAPNTAEKLRISGDFGSAGNPVLVVRVQPEPAAAPAAAAPIPAASDLNRWNKEVSANSQLNLSAADSGILVEAKLGEGDRWVYPRIDLQPAERARAGARELRLKLAVMRGDAHYRIIFVEDNGASYVAEPTIQPKPGEAAEVAVILEEAILGAGWSPPDNNSRLDPNRIKAIKVGCNARSELIQYTISSMKWTY